MTPDRDLLRQFADHGDQPAFAELVRRYADLVYSAALRVTENPALAQDVAQIVFTKLARQPEKLRGYDTFVGWLHTTTRHAAINTIRGEIRRRAREHEASAMHDHTPAPEMDWAQLRPVLDEAVDTLSDDDRKAVLLRFFQNLSHHEVGAILGLSEDAARKRVTRALDKLHTYFTHRGVTVSSALLATAITANSVHAAPVGLASTITTISLTGAATAATTESLFLKILLMSTKAKILLTLVAIALLAVAFTLFWPRPALDTLPTTGAPVAKSSVLPQLPRTASSPATPAAPVSASPVAPLANVAAATSFVAEPQTDLKAAIATGIHFLQSQDDVSFFKTLMQPGALAGEGKGSLDDFVAQLRQSPATAARLSKMLVALNALADKTPVINDAQNRATYTLDPPVAGYKVVIFVKIGTFWYLNGM